MSLDEEPETEPLPARAGADRGPIKFWIKEVLHVKSKRLFYRVMSMLLACLMALGCAEGLITTASAALADAWKADVGKMLVYYDSGSAGGYMKYKMTITANGKSVEKILEFGANKLTVDGTEVPSCDQKYASCYGYQFTVLTAADFAALGMNVVIGDDYGAVESYLSAAFKWAKISFEIVGTDAAVEAKTDQTKASLSPGWAMYMHSDVAIAEGTLGSGGSYGKITETKESNGWSGTSVEVSISDGRGGDLFMGENAIALTPSLKTVDMSGYNCPFYGNGSNSYMESYQLAYFFTQSMIGTDFKYLNPARNDQFKPYDGIATTWDGFIRYRTVLKGIGAAYEGANVPGMDVRKWLSGSEPRITLEAAKALETHYNATEARTGYLTGGARNPSPADSYDGKIYHIDSLPGMFYRVVNYSGSAYAPDNPAADYTEPLENLVKDINVRYEGDDLIIEYTLRSTNNSVEFFFIPVTLEGKTIKFLNGETFEYGARPYNYDGPYDNTGKKRVYQSVTFDTSVLEFPRELVDYIKWRNGSVYYGCDVKGDAYTSVSSANGSWATTVDAKDVDYYIKNGHTLYYGADCAGNKSSMPRFDETDTEIMKHAMAVSGDGSGQLTGHTTLRSVKMAYSSVDDPATFDAVHATGESPKVTFHGTMMYKSGGGPGISVSLNYLMHGSTVNIERRLRIEKKVGNDETVDADTEFPIEIHLGNAVTSGNSRPATVTFDEKNQSRGDICIKGWTSSAKFDDTITVCLKDGDFVELIFNGPVDAVGAVVENVTDYLDTIDEDHPHKYITFQQVEADGFWTDSLCQGDAGKVTGDATKTDASPEWYFPVGVSGKSWLHVTNSADETPPPPPPPPDPDNPNYDPYEPTPTPSLRQIIWHDNWQGTTTTTYPYPNANVHPDPDYNDRNGQVSVNTYRQGWQFYGWGDYGAFGADGEGNAMSGLEEDRRKAIEVFWPSAAGKTEPTDKYITSNGIVKMFLSYCREGDPQYYKDLALFLDSVFQRRDASGQGMTIELFAYWTPRPTYFHGNGGYFTGELDSATHRWTNSKWVDGFDETDSGNVYQLREFGVYTDNGLPKWTSATPYNGKDYFYPSPTTPVDYPHVVPYRVGYAFNGWYFDKDAHLPMTSTPETGIQPGVTYYAGWTPEKVIVRYHDTREGEDVVVSETYDYGDRLFVDKTAGVFMSNTLGQTFNGWSVTPGGDTLITDGAYLKKDVGTDNQNLLASGDEGKSYLLDENVNVLPGMKGDQVGEAMVRYTTDVASDVVDGVNVGASQGEYVPSADGGMTSYMHYWVLDLYSVWNKKTTQYQVTVNYNDNLDNDGARPVALKLGLVSSVRNEEVAEQVFQCSKYDEAQESDVFMFDDSFNITNVDSSVERTTYRFYVKEYQDIAGKWHVVQDTTAQSGVITLPTTSSLNSDGSMSGGGSGDTHGGTQPVTTYTYALDNINHIIGDTPASEATYAGIYTGRMYLNHSTITTGDDIKFSIEWDDDSNTDGLRSESVLLTLYANGEPVQDWYDAGNGILRNAAEVVVSEGMCDVSDDGNIWSYTFKDYQKYAASGEEITYTVVAKIPVDEGYYSVSYINPGPYQGSSYGCIFKHESKTCTVPVRIIWDDENNRDKVRPDSIVISLNAYQYNRMLGTWESVQKETKTLSAPEYSATDRYWFTSFSNMLVRHDGEDIRYYAEVISDLNGRVPAASEKYSWTSKATTGDMDEALESTDITISRLTDLQSVAVTVQWADRQNNDASRPSSVILELYADGKPLTEAFGWAEEDWKVVLSGDMTADEWTYAYERLPVCTEGQSGHKIVYSLKVAEAKPGDLYGEYEERGVLGEGHTFTRYTASYPKSGTAEFTETFEDSTQPVVRLTHEINQIEVPVKITWMDSNNRDAMRPSYVTLALTAYQWNDETYKWEYVETATQTVKADGANTMTADEWTASFGLRDMYHDGVKIIYHLAVVSDLNEFIPEGSYEYGWVETAHGNQVDAVPEVTVSQNVNITSVTSTVFWDDSNNQDNIRPKNIILQLYAHAPGQTPEAVSGEAYRVNLSGDPTADNWTYTFSGMPKYAAGQSGIELIYTVRAIEAEGEPLYGYYIITANGGEEEVLRYEASYLHEDREAGTTENTLDADLSDRAYVKLSHVCETKTMNFSVNWHDDDDRDAMRMSSVSVDLYKTVGSGEPKYLRTLVITAGDNGTWTYKVTGLPGYEGGQPVKYTIEIPEDVRAQLAAGGYTATTEDNIVHLYHTPETGEIRTQLYWSDEDDNDGYRTDSVIAALYANGTPTGRTADLNEGNGWAAAWTGLNAHYNQGAEHGLDIVYSVVIETPDGYTVAYNPADTTVEKNETLQIQLSHVKDTAEVPVNVFWNDTSNTDGKRPQNITVQLIADGRPTNNTLTLDAGNAGESENVWAGKFENMPVYGGDGEEIYYSLKVYDETTSTGGYSVMTAGTTLYLSYKPVKSSMYVSFQFSDGNNTDGRRPTGLYLQLKANGVPVDDSEYKHTVSFDTNVDGYFQNFGELPVYAADNTKIRYNVEVSFAPELGATDYDVWTSKDVKLSESSNAATNQIIVKLTRAVDETELTGHVYWFDCNDVEGNRPDALNIVVTDAYSGANVNYRLDAVSGEVYKVGTKTSVGKVNVSEWTGDSSVWTYTISGLPKNYLDKAGKTSLIYYYSKGNTAPIAMYYPTVYHGEDYGMDITLTHQHYSDYASKAAQDYTVNLMWLDNSNAWGYRPDSNGVKVELLANNEVYDTVYLTQADVVSGNGNAWTHTWKSIPTYRNGEPVLWSVRAADVTNYTIDRNKIVATATASTVCYGQSVGFDFAVNWDDSDNDDAKRPETIGLDIYADGKKADTVILHGEGNAWSGEIGDMIVWRENDADAAVQYTFRWDAATEKYLSDNGYTARATMNGTDVESNQFYWLSANEFGNNEDEGYDSLTGKYGWETTLGYNKEKADYRFNVVFNDDADRDGLRPETVTVDLYADGVKVDSKTVEINKTDSDYPIVWNQMDVNEGGKPVVYTIKLSGKYNGYSVAYNELNTAVTLTHVPERVDVTGFVNWDDASGLVNVYNADGVYVRSYEQIARTDVWMQLFADGEAYGEPVLIPASEYGAGENLERTGSRTWENLLKYRDNGTEIVYTMTVESEGLDALLNDGYGRVYDMGTKYEPSVTISHDLYDIRGTVYYLYTYSDDFLMKDVPVTAYRVGEDGTLTATGKQARTDENGCFEFRNLPQGQYTIRATYKYGENTLAGTSGVTLDRQDASTRVVINRDAVNDSDYYDYTATGKAFYQTDSSDPATIKPVPADSIVLLYKLVDGETNPVYVGMTTTNEKGEYSFVGLKNADYVVNVVFMYENGVYTYDNADAMADGLRFPVVGADVAWNDIIKQVNGSTQPTPPTEDPDNPPTPPEKPEPCVVSGSVFYSDNGVHTEEPIADVDVYVYLRSNNAELGHVKTDENGRWTMEGLGVNEYTAVFSNQGNESRVLLFDIDEADYDSGTYEAAPQYFDRNSGKLTGTISGTVLNENGQPIRSLVAIYGDDGELKDFAYTDTNGDYLFTVLAGDNYNVKILAVEDERHEYAAGDPDDDLTTVDYYTLSGIFSVKGEPKPGQMVAIYQQNDGGEYDLILATLTDSEGRFSAKVYEEGNYRVCPYINSEIYEVRNVSVGYQEERPSVDVAVNGTYTVHGVEDYSSYKLYRSMNGVEELVREEGPDGIVRSSYEILNVEAGTYRLELENGGKTTVYHFTCPEGTLVGVTYFVTVAGEVLDESGNAIIGAQVDIYNADGAKVRDTVIITADGKYEFRNLPEGAYQVVVTSPNTSSVIADKWTYEEDSYGKSYPTDEGMAPGGNWTWNTNAFIVSGRVTFAGEDVGVEGAVVMFTKPSDLLFARSAYTDADGYYRIGLAPGQYNLDARYEFDKDHIYTCVGTNAINLSSDYGDANFTIYRHEVAISTVREADGAKMPNVDVTISYSDGTVFWTGKTDSEGLADIYVMPGEWVFKAKSGSAEAVKTVTVVDNMPVVLELDSMVYITGTVMDKDGNPVGDGIVHYESDGNSGNVYTDDEGKYVIAVPSDKLGGYTLSASQGEKTGDPVNVEVLGDVTVDLSVEPGSGSGSGDEGTKHHVSGIVTDETGKRLANADVTIVYGDDKDKTFTTSTNSKGEYGFDMPDGTYYLTASYDAGNGEVYSTNSETAVHVVGGDVTQNLTVLIGYETTVEVVDTEGRPVAGAKVLWTGTDKGEAETGDDGTVTLYLAKGTYWLHAETAGRVSPIVRHVVDGNGNVRLVLAKATIKDEPPVVEENLLKIWGYVNDPAGVAVEGATAKLYRYDLETMEWNLVDEKTTGADGYYEFPDLEDGKYRVDTEFTQTSNVVLGDGGYEISGVVADDMGRPQMNASVELYGPDGVIVSTVVTDEDGKYTFENVDPELEYTITVYDASGKKIVDNEAAPVGATRTNVTGTVADVAGNIVPGATVTVKDSEGNVVTTVTVGEDGKYDIAVSSPEDQYTVIITYPVGYEVDTETYVRDTEDRNAPYLEPSWYTIRGEVHDIDGKSVEGATVILKDKSKNEIDRVVTAADGKYVFDHLKDGIYYVSIVIDGEEENEYRVDTGDEYENINVKVTNYAVRGTFTEPDGGWIAGENTFKVSNGKACGVFLVRDGNKPERLYASGNEGKTRLFKADLCEGDEIVVVVKGDVNLDGRVTVADLSVMNGVMSSATTVNAHAILAGDLNEDGRTRLSVADLSLMNQLVSGNITTKWNEQ